MTSNENFLGRFGATMVISTVDNSRETLACLVIDDPLLKPKYGCLDYKELLDAMKRHNFFTEIAFIPWNYRRSDTKTVQLLADNADYFSVCVHGCNHTDNEFFGGDYRELRTLLSTALWRMEQHKLFTGLPYDPVFVFPQGRFSSVAIQALKDQGFFAAFNSTLRATDVKEPPDSEYLRPATTMYHDFPLFLRRYPKEKSGFVSDLTNGRPIIIVEHHNVFRDGYKTITDLVDWVNSLGNIKWMSLYHIAEHYLGRNMLTIGQGIAPLSSSLSLSTKIAFRRFFSEARDNYLETSNLLTKCYKMVRG
jgi:predicted deacetylase